MVNKDGARLNWPMIGIQHSSWGNPKLLKIAIIGEVARWLPIKDEHGFPLLKIY
jgi:hypothetical protein